MRTFMLCPDCRPPYALQTIAQQVTAPPLQRSFLANDITLLQDEVVLPQLQVDFKAGLSPFPAASPFPHQLARNQLATNNLYAASAASNPTYTPINPKQTTAPRSASSAMPRTAYNNSPAQDHAYTKASFSFSMTTPCLRVRAAVAAATAASNAVALFAFPKSTTATCLSGNDYGTAATSLCEDHASTRNPKEFVLSILRDAKVEETKDIFISRNTDFKSSNSEPG
ncbi:uncharacterized protein K452DRAFT_311984 [Aplosporella prunicola CBS 121167]|uniref:Uncharacterized protein n=1 Tax=Aplosporella prunicola CBS 121167 TaxID=1176127 RepID=A0A6A6B3K7_9PEZI|nr:uncharacterized protein K452DRAFT_311984 [Aplosporella prunicola CBS 121167]KAF2137845.1 hypothetical protein K452DRAFT_311984 [Aplosporella prunicola CBS 121167]